MQERYKQLAPDLKLSRLLTGLWPIADMERDGQSLDLERAAQYMEEYTDAGLITFDMADHYGSAELIAGIFGRTTVGSKAQFFTKWVPDVQAKREKATVRKAIELSLRRLQTDQLDLLQYHAWNYADPAWLDDLFWLQELKESRINRVPLSSQL